jgi:hypothetical protein
MGKKEGYENHEQPQGDTAPSFIGWRFKLGILLSATKLC